MIRLKELREAKRLNMKEAARILNLPYTTYVNYEKGQREPTSEILILLADFFDTSVDFLVGRANRKYLTQPNEVSSIPSLTLDSIEEEIICKFRALDERGQSAVLNVINFEYNSMPGEETHSPAKEA